MKKKCKSPAPTIDELKEIDKKEQEAVDNFKKKAQEAISVIQENHFHLRLWKAIGGKE